MGHWSPRPSAGSGFEAESGTGRSRFRDMTCGLEFEIFQGEVEGAP